MKKAIHSFPGSEKISAKSPHKPVGLAPSAGVGMRADSVGSQAESLQMLNTKQRQQAMSQIGRVQGNGHVQRLVEVLQRQEGAEVTDEPLNTIGLGVDDKELTGHADQGGRFMIQRAPGDGTAAAPPAPTTTANINLQVNALPLTEPKRWRKSQPIMAGPM